MHRIDTEESTKMKYIHQLDCITYTNITDRIRDSIWNKSYLQLDYIELRTKLNKFEIFEEH